MAAMIGDSNFMRKACLDQEQNAYDQVKSDLASLDPGSKRRCREIARIAAPSYFMLNACVAQEVSAREAVKDFKFRK
jgi:hypothetical protein